MKKIILDFSQTTKTNVHKYLKEKFSFPDYYGCNLDALYDCLSEISNPHCVGVFNTEGKDLSGIIQVFKDSEQDNENLCFIFSKKELN
ncbi:MAG: barstar family protein [Bacteroidales bacterium]|nr:barstar family protein [Bacteroidales bacterium]